MRIDSSLYSDFSMEVERSTPSDGSAKSQSAASNKAVEDTASLSTSDESVSVLESTIKDLPDVRQERVAELRSSIENNNYIVTPEKIADAIYREVASLPRIRQPE